MMIQSSNILMFGLAALPLSLSRGSNVMPNCASMISG